MDASILDYELPNERIAKTPAQKRDESRLLVFNRKTEEITHAVFKDIPSILPHSYNFFRNDAAVLKARIFAKKPTGATVECLLLSPDTQANVWRCMLKPGKRLQVGATFAIDNLFKATVVEKCEDGQAIVSFQTADGLSVIDISEKIGVVPLPPYIARNQNSPDYDRSFDNTRYQTVYADTNKVVAAAAPTAGLHFTPELIQILKDKGNDFYNLTLNVGIGTFQPLKSNVVENHKMHAEIYEIPSKTLKALVSKDKMKLAVGTTSLRAMEDFCRKTFEKKIKVNLENNVIDSASLFVYPPQKVISADAMITNFHLPRSTLMCLVATFLKPESNDGIGLLKDIYRLAIEKEYNFYSYGDAMLIL